MYISQARTVMRPGQTLEDALATFVADMERLHGLGVRAQGFSEQAERDLVARVGERALQTTVPLAVDYYVTTVRQRFLQRLGDGILAARTERSEPGRSVHE